MARGLASKATISKSSASKAADGFSSAKLAMAGTRGELCWVRRYSQEQSHTEQVQGGKQRPGTRGGAGYLAQHK